jgi:argininosuccinate lyase
MDKEKKNSVWGTRVKKPTSKLLQSINSSIDVDKRLYNEDIEASIAHCEMLSKQKIINPISAKKIITGLKKIKIEIRNKKFEFKREHEDIHLNIEKRLYEIIGAHAGYLHAARSRNDQVITDFKLWLKKSSNILDKNLTLLIKSFLNKAKKNIKIIMPGFTHLKNAQPVLFSHYLLAYVEMFKRDKIKIKNFLNNIDENPLGSAALAGTSLNIDRHYTAKKLGFKKPTDNSIDSVADRDFVIEFLFISSLCSMHLSRLAEEIIIWNSDLVNLITIDDNLLTGSSIMPQKKNPDSAELIRGKTGQVFGNLVSMLTTMKGLPLAYFKDMQEDKASVFETYDTVLLNIQLATELVNGINPNKDKMFKAAKLGFTTATDFADYLVKRGFSFRDAHKKSAELVNLAEKNNQTLDELNLSTIKNIEKSVDKDVLNIFNISNSVQSKKSYGGTSAFNVIKMINKYQKEFK